MKRTIKLYSDRDRYPSQEYCDYTQTYGRADYLICGEFVKEFLGVDKEPPFILFAFNTKNPKEKGYKKISFGKMEFWRRDVFISGKKWRNTDFFPAISNLFPDDSSFNVWVKIEVI